MPQENPARPSTPSLPPTRRRKKRVDVGRVVARVLCVIFAFLGLVPFAIIVIVNSSWAKAWAATESEKLLAENGITATYEVRLHAWPLGVELSRIHVASTDGGEPLLKAQRVLVRPKVFALLSGKLAIDQVEVDSPQIRAVIRDGKLQNLELKLPEGEKDATPKAFHPPFNIVAVTDAKLDIEMDGARLHADAVDLDVTAEDDGAHAAALEIAILSARTTFHHSRIYGDPRQPKLAVDDDVLCMLEARVRYEPNLITVRRLEATGSADLDVRADTAPICDLANDDKRKVELALNNVHIYLPEKEGKLPGVDGRVKMRFPLGLAERAASLPETDGWIGVDVDIRFAEDTIVPDVAGRFEAHDIRLGQFSFAHEVDADILIRNNVIKSQKLKVWIGDGLATLSDVWIEPLAKGVWLRNARLDVADLSFNTLLKNLGVSKEPHVTWDVKELHSTPITGTFNPMQLDVDFTAQTKDFAVYDRSATSPGRVRLVGVSRAALRSHAAVTLAGLRFSNTQIDLGDHHSRVTDGSCFIGFQDDLRVEGSVDADLADLTPVGPVEMSGHLRGKAHIGGKSYRPEVSADIETIESLVLSGLKFGNVKGGHVAVDIAKMTVDIEKVALTKGTSPYEIPTARLEFGTPERPGFVVNALANAGHAGEPFLLKDLLAVVNLDTDPRFHPIQAELWTQGARVHVALGGKEDKCGGGYIDVRAKADLKNIKLYSESFVDGKADIELRWHDRLRGTPGADVDIQSFVLHKALAGSTALGTVLGSAQIQEGGALSANIVVDHLPVSQIQSLPDAYRSLIEGHVSAVAQVHGVLDEYNPAAGIDLQAGVEITPLRVKRVSLPASQLNVTLRQDLRTESPRGALLSGCNKPYNASKLPPADSLPTKVRVSGNLFDRKVAIDDLRMTLGKAQAIDGGNITLTAFDPIPFTKIFGDAAPSLGDEARLAARVSGTVTIGRLPFDDLAHGEVQYVPDELVFVREAAPARDAMSGRTTPLTVEMVPFKDPGKRVPYHPTLELRNGTLSWNLGATAATFAPLRFAISSEGGLRGAIELRHAELKDVGKGKDASILVQAGLTPIDLGELAKFYPKIERASGRVEGEVLLAGTLASPTFAGRLQLRGDELLVRGMPSAMTDFKATIDATAHTLHAEGSADFGGGTIALRGDAPLVGFSLGSVDATVTGRSLHFAPSDGVSAALDADLRVRLDPESRAGSNGKLPLVSGDVMITSFDYTHPVNLTSDLTALGGRARRTVIETYDPSLDSVMFDIHVRTQQPLRIKNNFAELKLAIDSRALTVSGTNQRIGLRGELRALPGGHFRFQASDFEISKAEIRFEDPSRIAAVVDVQAATEYRRYTDTGASAAAAGAAGGGGAGAARGGYWRINLHAYGDTERLRLDMSSEPNLSQEDIILLLTIGMTRAELDQLQASSLGAAIALNYLGSSTGADRAVKNAIPVIDDFRFGSGYSTRTFKTEPQLTIGKRITENIRASVTTSLVAEDRELRSNIEWRLNQRMSVQGTYETGTDLAQSAIGNLGVNLRWRLEFE